MTPCSNSDSNSTPTTNAELDICYAIREHLNARLQKQFYSQISLVSEPKLQIWQYGVPRERVGNCRETFEIDGNRLILLGYSEVGGKVYHPDADTFFDLNDPNCFNRLDAEMRRLHYYA